MNAIAPQIDSQQASASNATTSLVPTVEMIQAAAVLSVQGISDGDIINVLGSRGMLIAIRQHPFYADEIARLTSESLTGELKTDAHWDKLEFASLQNLSSQVQAGGAHMEPAVLLAIAKQANSAVRRHGTGSRRNLETPDGKTAVVINIPSILLQRIEIVSREPVAHANIIDHTASDAESGNPASLHAGQYAAFSSRDLTAADVSSVLGIDVTQKPRPKLASDLLGARDLSVMRSIADLVSATEG